MTNMFKSFVILGIIEGVIIMVLIVTIKVHGNSKMRTVMCY